MRPAQKAPENRDQGRSRQCGRRRFNEAGAKSAGKLQEFSTCPIGQIEASMRPAQKAPENVSSGCAHGRRREGFNEAGAKSAGKQTNVPTLPFICLSLQ